jgi:D-psicose/D-tagatose/L-ribulose 3-epimerase
MKYGMNLLLWTAELNDGIIPALKMIKSLGYDGVEIPLFNYDLDYAVWSGILDEFSLQRTAVTVRRGEDNPISPNPVIRQRGIDQNRKAIDCAAAVGATHLVGPFYAALGEFTGSGPNANEWNWGVDGIREVSEHAASRNVMLAIEPLNRFEIYLLNSCADAARFVQQVAHPNCGLMYDTFHANIEEKSVFEALQIAGDHLVHLHISENDRSTPGSGGIRWSETFEGLKAIGFDGWLVVEAFGLALAELRAATKIWRRMYDSEEQLSRDALSFLKSNT